MLIYVEPDIAPDESGYSVEVQKSVPMMGDEELGRIVQAYLSNLDVEELKRGDHSDKYRFSLYDTLYRVPPYSYVTPSAWRGFVGFLTQRVGPFTGSEEDVRGTALSKLLGIESALFNMASQPSNLFLRLNVLDKHGRFREERRERPLEYKIHLCVKEEYAFYAFLKLAVAFYPEFRKIYPDEYLELKWNLDARMTRLNPDDSVYREQNGGPAASIVIYTRTAEQYWMTFMLRAIITLFPEADTIGFMELTGNATLPYSNVRLNKMLCYAQGDRGTKLRTKRNNLTKKNGARSQKSIPDWIFDIKSKCPANDLSQLYLGVDICSTGDTLHDEQCVDDLCYLALDKNMLDPRLVVPKGGRRKKTRRVCRKTRTHRS
jgi:hypothetical protein